MYQTLRTTIWMLLIGGGIFGVLGTFIFSTSKKAFVLAICVVALWVFAGVLSQWIFGLKRRVTKHMKRGIDNITIVTKDVGASRLADYIRTLESLCESQPGVRYGIPTSSNFANLKITNIGIEKVDWETIEGEDETLVSVPSNAVYLLRHEGNPFVAKLASRQRHDMYEHEDGRSTGKGETLELCAATLDQANAVIQWLKTQTSEHSIYRGRFLQIASPQDGTAGQTIRLSAPPEQKRDAIILPDELLTLLERLIHSRLQHRDRLKQFGHKANLGILLHGAPGTGKTMVTRYLISSCPDHTVIVPSDMAVETLRESFRLARYLQPSILILEDVDLLAPRRDLNVRVDGLQELMNEMDGLGAASDTIVIMSTNRPEILEPALASRPGRISQTVKFPLPDETHRAKLLELFLEQTHAGSLLIDEWAERTEGASPAFLEELCKRAILLASERGEGGESIDVQFGDMHNAIHELVVIGGELTSKALGFPQQPD